MNEDEKAPVELLSVIPSDRQLHANLLVVHQDDHDSPSCTAAHVGHYLRYARGASAPFPSGNLVATTPFLIETSRLGKPFDRVTHDDLASLNRKYGLAADVRFTVLLRREVSNLDRTLIQADINEYAATYHAHREDDVGRAYDRNVTKIGGLELLPGAVFDAFFSLESVPSPVLSMAATSRETDDAGMAHGLLWLLSQNAELRRSFAADSTAGEALIRVHTLQDGTYCVAVARPHPHELADHHTELVHFHQVASNKESVENVVACLVDLFNREFGLQARIVEVRGGGTGSSCGRASDANPDVFQLDL